MEVRSLTVYPGVGKHLILTRKNGKDLGLKVVHRDLIYLLNQFLLKTATVIVLCSMIHALRENPLFQLQVFHCKTFLS